MWFQYCLVCGLKCLCLQFVTPSIWLISSTKHIWSIMPGLPLSRSGQYLVLLFLMLMMSFIKNIINLFTYLQNVSPPTGEKHMNTIAVKDGIEIYYKDWRSSQPIVFSHGWPLSADDWDNQMMFFLNHGYRVIAHDRRGHGRSSQGGTRTRYGSLRR